MTLSYYESFECDYTCGHSLRKFLRCLSLLGMISSIVYMSMGTYIIVHIVETEKVEWFPNAYYRINLNNDEPVARKVVFPESANFFPRDPEQDFLIYPFPPRDQDQQQQTPPFLPHHPSYPDSSEGNDSKSDEGDRTVYFRKNAELFICLAASLIIVNFIQFIVDICVFTSTFTRKHTTSFWVYFLLNIIIWIMTLICFILIFTDGGFLFLLVFTFGTMTRVYMVYILHELMSDMRKLRAFSESSLQESTAKEIRPEPRALMDAEEGSSSEGYSVSGSACPLNDEMIPSSKEETEVVPFQNDCQVQVGEETATKTEKLQALGTSCESDPGQENDEEGNEDSAAEEEEDNSSNDDDEDEEGDEDDCSFMTQLEAHMIEKEPIEPEEGEEEGGELEEEEVAIEERNDADQDEGQNEEEEEENGVGQAETEEFANVDEESTPNAAEAETNESEETSDMDGDGGTENYEEEVCTDTNLVEADEEENDDPAMNDETSDKDEEKEEEELDDNPEKEEETEDMGKGPDGCNDVDEESRVEDQNVEDNEAKSEEIEGTPDSNEEEEKTDETEDEEDLSTDEASQAAEDDLGGVNVDLSRYFTNKRRLRWQQATKKVLDWNWTSFAACE